MLGGVGFRDGSLPIVVQVGDAVWHHNGADARSCGTAITYSGLAAAHTKEEARAALLARSIKAIGIASTEIAEDDVCSPRPDMVYAAIETGAVVEPAAWDDPQFGGRPVGCAANQCCTGLNGAGRASDAGVCPLVFDVASDGSGAFATQIVQAVKILVNYAELDVSSRPTGTLQATAAAVMIDPTDFITAITPIGLAPVPPGGMTVDPTGKIILGLRPGIAATFEVTAQNDFVPGATDPQVFVLQIQVVGDGVTVLDTRQVVIIVPPAGTVIS